MQQAEVKRNNFLFEFLIIIIMIIIITLILRGAPRAPQRDTDIEHSVQSSAIDESSSVDRGEPTGVILYEVQAGDTLWNIAAEYSIDLDVIYSYNPGLEDQKSIYPGDRIRLPSWE